MKKIFATTDLSPNSKAGIRFAVQFAKQLDAELIFCLIVEMTKPTSWSDKHYNRFEKEIIESKTALLKNFVGKTIEGNAKVLANATFVVQLSLNVDRSIINAAKRCKADFICMSTRGAGKVRKLFGTNASAIVTTSSVPVIVVPKRYRVSTIDRLFFACDFSALKQEMIPVQMLANELNAKLEVYHYDYLLHLDANARKLQQKSEQFKSENVSFHFKKLDIDRTLSEHLSEDIKKEKSSLVILFTKQDKNWFNRLIVPSEAVEMSFNASRPLLTFKKKA